MSDNPAGPGEGSNFRTGDIACGADRYRYMSLPATPSSLPPSLTESERQVAELAALGASSRAIAASRGTSVRTVERQLASLYRKLNVTGRGELYQQLLGGHVSGTP